jgi:hypothetical protein
VVEVWCLMNFVVSGSWVIGGVHQGGNWDRHGKGIGKGKGCVHSVAFVWSCDLVFFLPSLAHFQHLSREREAAGFFYLESVL